MHWLTSVPGCSKQSASGYVMLNSVKQLDQQLAMGGLLGAPVPEGGNGGCPPVPVKTGAGAWPSIGADDEEGISEIDADEVDTGRKKMRLQAQKAR